MGEAVSLRSVQVQIHTAATRAGRSCLKPSLAHMRTPDSEGSGISYISSINLAKYGQDFLI